MAIINRGLSALKSDLLNTSLTDTEFNQRQVLFNGGSIFNFADILSGAVDVKTKNYSSFYLTRKTKLDSNTQVDRISFQPSTILTGISSSTSVISILSSPNNVDYLSVKYPLTLTDSPLFFPYFRINFIDDEYCNIQYDDSVGKNYMVLENNACVLKRGITLSDSDKSFRYIKADNKIVFLKDISGSTYIINKSLSAIPLSSNAASVISEGYFTIGNNLSINETSSNNTSYITYKKQSMDIDETLSDYDLENNYLLFRNLNINSLNDVNTLVLKNQMNDLNTLSRSNNLSLSSGAGYTDYRTYTSISNDISQLEDEGLNLNYTFYNKSITLNPGENTFVTEKSLFPFSQININDTTLSKAGAFGSNSPLYSDRVYKYDENNLGERYVYLCSWLSGSPGSENNIWLDRYYYPNLVTKQAAISSIAIYSRTYEQYIEQIVFNNATNTSTVADNLFFDKLSDLVFTPDTKYIYERVDLEKLPFLSYNIADTGSTGYYLDINRNSGFVLAFNLINQNDTVTRTIFSRTNEIAGGLTITYNNTLVTIQYSLYDTSGQYKTFTSSNSLNLGSDNNIVFSVNNITGSITCYVNGEIIIEEKIAPLFYSSVLYGDFVVVDKTLSNSQDYISEIYLSPQPLDDEAVKVLTVKYNDNSDKLVISLPCGMRNKSDAINQVNSLTTNLKSKTNSINVYISDLDIDDEDTKVEIIRNIELITDEVLPINSNINKIELL